MCPPIKQDIGACGQMREQTAFLHHVSTWLAKVADDLGCDPFAVELIAPESGSNQTNDQILSKVDSPQPLGPMRTVVLPRWTEQIVSNATRLRSRGSRSPQGIPTRAPIGTVT